MRKRNEKGKENEERVERCGAIQGIAEVRSRESSDEISRVDGEMNFRRRYVVISESASKIAKYGGLEISLISACVAEIPQRRASWILGGALVRA